MRAQLLTNPRAGNHCCIWREAFAKGLERHGWKVRHTESYDGPTDLLVMWGAKRRDVAERARKEGADVCILERGYLGDRFNWTSVSFGGGLNGRAQFRINPQVFDRCRWQRQVPHYPSAWREEDGGRALIMGQVPGDQSIRGMDFSKWVTDTTAELSRLGYQPRHRPHPGDRRGFRSPVIPLEADLASADLVVTWNSNSAVDAVLAGVPTVAMDRGSMAWPVTAHEIGKAIIRPDRSEWLARLAWKQYSLQEMESGFCAEAVGLHDWRRKDGPEACEPAATHDDYQRF
jgi:hypothetical protein